MTWPDRPRILQSYAYVDKMDRDEFARLYAGTDLLIDSGAFTAASLGKVIDRSAYVEYLLERAALISHAASLDVIGDWRTSARNYEWMVEKLDGRVDLLPVWHLGSPIHELERLCASNTFLAIGGCVPYASRPEILMRHLVQAHRIAREHGTGLHGLGVTGKQTMFRLPWATVDSSTWLSGARYGKLRLFDGRGFRDVALGKKPSLTDARLIRAFGGDPAAVAIPRFGIRTGRGAVGVAEARWINRASARAFMAAEEAKTGERRALRLYLSYGDSRHHTPIIREAWSEGPLPPGLVR